MILKCLLSLFGSLCQQFLLLQWSCGRSQDRWNFKRIVFAILSLVWTHWTGYDAVCKPFIVLNYNKVAFKWSQFLEMCLGSKLMVVFFLSELAIWRSVLEWRFYVCASVCVFEQLCSIFEGVCKCWGVQLHLTFQPGWAVLLVAAEGLRIMQYCFLGWFKSIPVRAQMWKSLSAVLTCLNLLCNDTVFNSSRSRLT